MDTATHFAMGFGLAGLAHLDPAVSASPELAQAVMLGTVIGSQAPDLDGLTRLRGSASYIRNHRGMSHSIPAIFVWTLAAFAFVQAVLPQAEWLHLLAWVFLAVFLHVFVDLFNSYGTQGLAPFSRKWIALNTIFIFDPVIFGMHILGFMAWLAGGHPGLVFLIVYLALAVYYYVRFRAHQRAVSTIKEAVGMAGEYTVLPTFFWNQWTFLVKTETHWYVGEAYGQEIHIVDTFTRKPADKLVQLAMEDPKVQSFLYFSSYTHVETKQHDFGYEVRWIDLRYRARNPGKSHYAFVAAVYIDNQYRIHDSFVGWIHRGEEQLAKKLEWQQLH